MKLNIIGITLGIILGVPAVALGSSFTYSLVQGQSPSEAIVTIGDQINSLFGRVDSIEAEQQIISDRLDALEKDTSSDDLAPDEKQHVSEPEVELKQFALDAKTQSMCDEAAAFENVNQKSVKGNIQALCVRLNEKYETQEQFNEVVSNLNKKWELWIKASGGQQN